MDSPIFDWVLAGGDVIDGSGAAPFRADIGIVGDRIAAIGSLSGARCHKRVDVRGKVVTPGFIDTHTHDDTALMLWPAMPMKVGQGVTTVVIGNCGISLAPSNLLHAPPPPLDLIGTAKTYRFRTLAAYFDYFAAEPPALNFAALAGHMTLRASTMPRLDRAADSREISAMKSMLDEAMDAGALGISTGLAYSPSAAASTDEVVELADHVGRRGGMYCTHIRDEADDVVPSLCEACDIAHRARLPLVISHHKVLGKANFGRSVQTIELLERASKRQALAIDAYPYAASSTVLKMERVRQSTSTLVTWSTPMPEAAGRTLADMAAALGCDLEQAVAQLSPAGAIYFAMDEADVRRILTWPGTMIGSDGLPQDEFPHPRLWGTFSRILGHYVREQGLMTLEQAVHRMTGLPAYTFGLRHRGHLKNNFFADLVVFDAARIADTATYSAPISASAGIELVMVNGRMVWDQGRTVDERPGRVLRRQDLDAPMADFQAPQETP